MKDAELLQIKLHLAAILAGQAMIVRVLINRSDDSPDTILSIAEAMLKQAQDIRDDVEKAIDARRKRSET